VRRALALALVLSACPPAPEHPASRSAIQDVVDMHADLGVAVHAGHATLDDSTFALNADRLRRGGVRTLVVPLFALDASERAPSDVRLDYAAVRAEVEAELSCAGHPVEIVYAFEGADGFVDRPEALDAFASEGACLLGVMHRRSNALGGASQEPDHEQRARGLSDAGRAVAERALADGMLLDVAHASDATFDDLAAVAEAHGSPLVDSHTGMRALLAIDRNLDDARARRIASSGGVVAIDVHGGHVGSVPGEPPSIDDVVAHVLHALAVAGAEHVALGSDFGGGIVAPTEADGAAWWPVLAARLRLRGVDEGSLAALFSGNARRVLARCRGLHR